jgi:tripartite-type tricarboxylate transporter receptor subunit TctC
MAGVDIAHIPYKGGPEVTNALISGQVDMMFNGGNTFSYLKTGKVRAIASTGLKRSVSMPQLPTLHECGFVGFDILPWFGVFAPSSLSRELIEKLNFEFVSRLKIMQTQDKFLGQGIEIAPSSPEYLSALMKSDMVNQAKLMRKAGITPE